MKPFSTAYAFFRNVAVLCLLTSLLFCAFGNGDIHGSGVNIASERFQMQGSDNIEEVFGLSKVMQTSDLHVRSKVKTNVFFKKMISFTKTFVHVYLNFNIRSHYILKVFTLRPGYYTFLFRYTPF